MQLIFRLIEDRKYSEPQPQKPEPIKTEAVEMKPEPVKPVETKPDQPVILDPTNPQLDVNQSISSETSPWKFGAKKVLSSVSGVCQRLNNLILKVVAKVFPWNRRAKRRLAMATKPGDPEDLDEDF